MIYKYSSQSRGQTKFNMRYNLKILKCCEMIFTFIYKKTQMAPYCYTIMQWEHFD